jgi:hypothetical protein
MTSSAKPATAKPTVACANCDFKGDFDDLAPYRDFWSRIEPGGEMPAGDCPECGAFAYVIKEKESV